VLLFVVMVLPPKKLSRCDVLLLLLLFLLCDEIVTLKFAGLCNCVVVHRQKNVASCHAIMYNNNMQVNVPFKFGWIIYMWMKMVGLIHQIQLL